MQLSPEGEIVKEELLRTVTIRSKIIMRRNFVGVEYIQHRQKTFPNMIMPFVFQ